MILTLSLVFKPEIMLRRHCGASSCSFASRRLHKPEPSVDPCADKANKAGC